jgi:hypothetical protein
LEEERGVGEVWVIKDNYQGERKEGRKEERKEERKGESEKQ